MGHNKQDDRKVLFTNKVMFCSSYNKTHQDFKLTDDTKVRNSPSDWMLTFNSVPWEFSLHRLLGIGYCSAQTLLSSLTLVNLLFNGSQQKQRMFDLIEVRAIPIDWGSKQFTNTWRKPTTRDITKTNNQRQKNDHGRVYSRISTPTEAT